MLSVPWLKIEHMQEVLKEVVLPSGRFARIRGLTGRDYLAMIPAVQREGKHPVFVLMCLATSIDGESITYEQILDMDMRDVNVLANEVAKYVTGPV